jgi:hypothetical protein
MGDPTQNPQQQPDDPFAGIAAQQQAPAQQTSPDDPFAPIAQAVAPSQQDQPGFWSRAYETSPLPGMIDAAKNSVNHFIDAPDQHTADLHDMVTALSAGDLRGAAGKAAKLLTGSENPFSNAAQSVVKLYVDDAKANYQKLKGGNLSDIPAGNAATNYVSDVKAGNTAGAIGDVVGGVSSIAPALLGDEATAAKAGDVAGKVADTAGQAKALVSEDAAAAKAQPVVQGAIRDAAEQQSNLIRAKEGAAPEAPPSVRDAMQNVGDSVLERSKAAFNQLDEVSGGRWQRFDDQLKNLRDKMDEVSGIDEDAYDKFDQRAKDVEAAQSDLVNQLVRDGKIDPELADSAKADYKQGNALHDLSAQIRGSASGLRPELGEGTPETVDPTKLSPRLNKLFDSGRLQQALGDEGAAKLVKQVDDAVRTKASAIKTAKLVKTVAKYGAGAIGLGVLGHGALSALGGH